MFVEQLNGTMCHFVLKGDKQRARLLVIMCVSAVWAAAASSPSWSAHLAEWEGGSAEDTSGHGLKPFPRDAVAPNVDQVVWKTLFMPVLCIVRGCRNGLNWENIWSFSLSTQNCSLWGENVRIWLKNTALLQSLFEVRKSDYVHGCSGHSVKVAWCGLEMELGSSSIVNWNSIFQSRWNSKEEIIIIYFECCRAVGRYATVIPPCEASFYYLSLVTSSTSSSSFFPS